MGDPKRLRKKYDAPKRPWDKQRIISENKLNEIYGLTGKREIWVAKTLLTKKRASARKLLAARSEQVVEQKKKLINSLARYGILSLDATIDDVLSLKVEDFLERRLQTLVLRKGLANTPKQARQFITHGLITISGKRVKSPGYFVKIEEERLIGYYNGEKPKVMEVKMTAPEMQKIAEDAKTEELPETKQEEGM